MAGSSLPAFKTAFVAMATAAFDGQDIEVLRNRRKYQLFTSAVVVGTGQSNSDPATLSANMRTRNEDLTLEVTIYSYVPGGEEAEEPADTAAYSMLTTLEEQVRVTDTTVGGTVRYCFLTSHVSAPAEDDNILSRGRLTIIIATFSANARITS